MTDEVEVRPKRKYTRRKKAEDVVTEAVEVKEDVAETGTEEPVEEQVVEEQSEEEAVMAPDEEDAVEEHSEDDTAPEDSEEEPEPTPVVEEPKEAPNKPVAVQDAEYSMEALVRWRRLGRR